VNAHLAEISLRRMYLKIITISSIYVACRGKRGAWSRNSGKKARERRQHTPAINMGRSYSVATVCEDSIGRIVSNLNIN